MSKRESPTMATSTRSRKLRRVSAEPAAGEPSPDPPSDEHLIADPAYVSAAAPGEEKEGGEGALSSPAWSPTSPVHLPIIPAGPISEDDERTGLLSEETVQDVRRRLNLLATCLADLEEGSEERDQLNAEVSDLQGKLRADSAASGEPFNFSAVDVEEHYDVMGCYDRDYPEKAAQEVLEGYEELPEHVQAVVQYARSLRPDTEPDPENPHLTGFADMPARDQLAVFQHLSNTSAEKLMRVLSDRAAIKLKTVRAACAAVVQHVRRLLPGVDNPIMFRVDVRLTEEKWEELGTTLKGIFALLGQARFVPTAFRSANGCRTACVFGDALADYEDNLDLDEDAEEEEEEVSLSEISA